MITPFLYFFFFTLFAHWDCDPAGRNKYFLFFLCEALEQSLWEDLPGFQLHFKITQKYLQLAQRNQVLNRFSSFPSLAWKQERKWCEGFLELPVYIAHADHTLCTVQHISASVSKHNHLINYIHLENINLYVHCSFLLFLADCSSSLLKWNNPRILCRH